MLIVILRSNTLKMASMEPMMLSMNIWKIGQKNKGRLIFRGNIFCLYPVKNNGNKYVVYHVAPNYVLRPTDHTSHLIAPFFIPHIQPINEVDSRRTHTRCQQNPPSLPPIPE